MSRDELLDKLFDGITRKRIPNPDDIDLSVSGRATGGQSSAPVAVTTTSSKVKRPTNKAPPKSKPKKKAVPAARQAAASPKRKPKAKAEAKTSVKTKKATKAVDKAESVTDKEETDLVEAELEVSPA